MIKKNIIFVTPELAKKRADICSKCPHNIVKFKVHRCELCSCMIVGKTRVSGAKCPIDKW